MTLFGAIGESARTGKSVFIFKGELSPLGVLVVETPFFQIDDVFCQIQSTGQVAPTTIVCTFETLSSVIKVYGWMSTVGFMPMIPSDGEETVSIAVIGKKSK